MPSARTKTRAPDDRMLDLVEAGARVGYAAETLRKMMAARTPDAPPGVKVGPKGLWRIWQSDLDAWVDQRQDKVS